MPNLSSKVVFGSAVVCPLLLVGALVLLTYAPGLPGSPPRSVGRALFLLPSIVAVGILQALPFESLSRRLLLTGVFGAVMFAVLLMAYVLGACGFGDCF